MNPVPVATVGGDARPFPETPEAVAATAVRVAVFFIAALGPPPQWPRNPGAGATQNASVHVRRALLPSGGVPPNEPAKDWSVMSPHDGPIELLNGTVTWWVTSCTESILPAVPQWIVKSAARASPAPIPSRFRIGAFGTVLYDARWKIVVTPGRAPALRLRSAWTHA